MNPLAKTLLLIFSTIASVLLVPAILIVFHEYLNAFFAISLFISCFVVFGISIYEEYYPLLRKKQLEEEEIVSQFHGDKQKIKFYKGFKKHFEGSLSVEGLEKWFEHHPDKR